jgi:hypothetical protein
MRNAEILQKMDFAYVVAVSVLAEPNLAVDLR